MDIEKRKQDLIAGLADLYIQKEDIEKNIVAQKAAINEIARFIEKEQEPCTTTES